MRSMEAGFKGDHPTAGEVDKVAGDYLTGQLVPAPAICSCGQ